MDEFFLNDPLNLKGQIQYIATFMKEANAATELDTILGFLTQLFSHLDRCYTESETETEKLIRAIQKALSGNPPSQRLRELAADIAEGRLDEYLHEMLRPIVAEICQIRHSQVLWDSLLLKASPLFFEKTELQRLQELTIDSSSEKRCEFLLLLIKHGFSTLDNIPELAAKRIYDEAQTYDFDQPARFRLLKVAADYGNRQAALEYGNYMNRTRADGVVPPQDAAEAFHYTLMALPLPSAMWNLAYQLESLQLSAEQFDLLCSTLKINEKLKSNEYGPYLPELDSVACMAASDKKRISYNYAYKIYFYLAYSGFSKGFNSLSKLLSQPQFEFKMLQGTEYSDKYSLADHYLRKAVMGGCVAAMQSAGIQNYKQLSAKENLGTSDLQYTEQLLQTASYYGMSRSLGVLGDFYLGCSPKRDVGKAIGCYQEALKIKKDGGIYYRLGLLSSSRNEKTNYFKCAMDAGNANAAYQYVLCELGCSPSSKNRGQLRWAIDVLSQYIPQMSQEIQEQAKYYERDLQDLLRCEKEQVDIAAAPDL